MNSRLAIVFAWGFALLVGPRGAAAVERIAWSTGRIQGSPLPPAPYRTERHFPKIQFDHPVDLSPMPGSSRLVIAEESGKLWSFDPATPTRPDLLIDLRQHHRPFANVLGFTFHPGFAT